MKEVDHAVDAEAQPPLPEVQLGNALELGLGELEDFDGLFTGPPCQGWSNCGPRLGWRGCGSSGMARMLECVEEMAERRGSLLFFLLAGSPSMLDHMNGRSPSAHSALRTLRRKVPWFVVDYGLINLEAHLPEKRTGCFLRGVRGGILAATTPCGAPLRIPLPVHGFGRAPVSLGQILDMDVANVTYDDIPTSMQRKTLYWGESIIAQDLLTGKAGTIAVLDLSRSPDSAFKSRIYYDEFPMLTTSGPQLFVLSTHDVATPEPEKRVLFRFLTMAERFSLMGFPGERSKLMGICDSRTLSGNAIAVPMACAVFAPIARCSAGSKLMGAIPDRVTMEEPGEVAKITEGRMGPAKQSPAPEVLAEGQGSVLGTETASENDGDARPAERRRRIRSKRDIAAWEATVRDLSCKPR